LVAPSALVRDKAAELIGREKFIVVYVDAPLDICQQRDPRGHYKSAQQSQLPQLPGVGAFYEAPAAPDLVLKTSEQSIDECVQLVLQLLRERRVMS
jgi:adenylylsulfate kinase-like enzyme